MLISQRQAPVSSDTSCAMGNRRDFFVLSPSLSVPQFMLISSNTDWEWGPNQQTGVNAAWAVTNKFVMNDFRVASPTPPRRLVYEYHSLKNLYFKLCCHTSRHYFLHTLCFCQLSSTIHVTETTTRAPRQCCLVLWYLPLAQYTETA